MNRKFLILLTVISLMAGYAFSFEPIPDATPETFLGGRENLALVNAAKTVRVFRILSPERARRLGPGITIDKVICQARTVEVAGPEVPQVVAAMSNMASFGQMLTCDFDPGMILRFEANGHTLSRSAMISAGRRADNIRRSPPVRDDPIPRSLHASGYSRSRHDRWRPSSAVALPGPTISRGTSTGNTPRRHEPA